MSRATAFWMLTVGQRGSSRHGPGAPRDASHYGEVGAGMQRVEATDHKVGNSRWRISPSCGLYVTVLISRMRRPVDGVWNAFAGHFRAVAAATGVYGYGKKRANTLTGNLPTLVICG